MAILELINEPFTHRRGALAASYCDALEGRGILDASPGLFLAGPRRTGKSTFLREDLMPQMRLRGWEPLYVDLWSDRARDPAGLIIAAIRQALARFDGSVLKAAKRAGLEKLTVLKLVSLDFSKISQPGGATIADALQALHTKCGKALALLVDEAQHALSSPAGVASMFALKAARDRLNQGHSTVRGVQRGLHLMMTGSNRDKLTHLMLRKSQPFFGAGVTRFPLLDQSFIEAYAQWLNRQFAPGCGFEVDVSMQAFELVGHRPEMLKTVVGEAVTELGGAAGLSQQLAHNAQQLQRRAWNEFESTYNGLPPAQKAVFDAVARLSPGYEPFAEVALSACQATLGKPLTTSALQGALDALRDKELIWRAGRGDYALEDGGLQAWYLQSHPQPPVLTTPPVTFARPN